MEAAFLVLEAKYKSSNREYYCDLTRELDGIAGYCSRYRHYLLDVRDAFDSFFEIGVPGRTIGDIEIDDENTIINIVIASDLTGDGLNYPKNIETILSKYAGAKLETNVKVEVK